jgi:hypothetical protein
MLNPSKERQDWIEAATQALRQRFGDAGYDVPETTRVSIGFPKRGAACNGIGECWTPTASSDQHTEIFVSPELTDGKEIIAALAHLLAHSVVGRDLGHKVEFKHCARAVGLSGPMRGATPSSDFEQWIADLMLQLDLYPAGHLTDTPKQTTRMKLCVCEHKGHGYSCRTTKKWLDREGPPICPIHGVVMTVKS